MKDKIVDNEHIGPCDRAWKEIIKIRSNSIGAGNKYPLRTISETEFCDLSGTKYTLTNMKINNSIPLPCGGEPNSSNCCFDFE